MRSHIDTSFDFRSDTPPGKDPDAHSPTLRRYHRLLWSKPLPAGAAFRLIETTPQVYLHHRSDVGEFCLSSDAVIPTFTRELRIAHVIEQIPLEQRESFIAFSYTIGGMMVFPGQRVDGKMTLNGARGFHPRVKDRFDLTVECIRRHYRGEQSPLSATLSRYADFFSLFGDFRGYISYFLLQDLVSDSSSEEVQFFLPFDDFQASPLPRSREAYLAYRQRAIGFIEARNCRIASFCRANPWPS